MTNKKLLAKKHATQYIAEVFENSLRNAGFFCPNDDLLCWYRIRSSEIFNSIIFHSAWSALPLFLDMGYGIIPSFEMPLQINDVVYNDLADSELITSHAIVENYPNGGIKAPFSDNICVYAPMQDGRGIYTFEELLLPHMDRIHTIQEAYCFFKDRDLNLPLVKQNEDYHARMQSMVDGASKTFINMALWVDDTEIYPYALTRINQRINVYQKLCRRFPKRKDYQYELATWRDLLDALENDSRDAYVKKLAQKMEPNTKLVLHKYF